MHRPLWQTFLCLFLLAFVARNAAMVFLARLEGLSAGLVAAHALQGALAIAVVVGLWRARRWTIGAVLALGVTVVATAALEGFVLGVIPSMAALGQVLVASLATAALVAILNHELGPAGTARGSGNGSGAGGDA